MPPPTAIEPGVPYSAEDTEGKSYGSHFELLASGETPNPDAAGEADGQESDHGIDLELPASDELQGAESANVVDAGESASAPALESSPAPVPHESPDGPEPPREAKPFEEYDLDLESLTEPGSGEPPDEAEPPREDEGTASGVAASDVEALESDPAVFEESESETIGDPAPEFEEASDAAESAVEGYAPVAPEIPEESEVRVIDVAVSEDEEPPAASIPDEPPDETEMSHESEPLEGYGDDFEALAVPESDDSPDEAEPLREDEEPASDITEKALEESEPEPEAVQVAADLPLEEPDEPSEASPVENGFLPLVRDARGNWRPGKGFSRSELREAGLSPAEAARLHICVDKRRRNAHPVNVATLERAKSGV